MNGALNEPRVAVFLLGCLVAGCPGNVPDDVGPDVPAVDVPGLDAGQDAGLDALIDDAGGPDAADAGSDAGHDAFVRSDAGLVCPTPTTTRALAVAADAACRVTTAGELECWGMNAWGLLGGDASWVEPHVMRRPEVANVVEVVLGFAHACVLHDDGGVSCWGDNRGHGLGDGTFLSSDRPTRVAGLTEADHLIVGNDVTCAHERSGAWICWGLGNVGTRVFGALEITAPTEVPDLRGALRVALGPVSAVLRPDGHVDSSRAAAAYEAYEVPAITDAIDVASAGFLACALHATGRVSCWHAIDGGNSEPEDVGLDDVQALVSSPVSFSLCAQRGDGSLFCWGSDHSLEPLTQVAGIGPVAAAAMGGYLCALTCDDAIVCNGPGIWGENGEGSRDIEPFTIPSVDDAVAVDEGCVLRVDGTVLCRDPVRHAAPILPECPAIGAGTLLPTGLTDGVELHAECVRRRDGVIACARAGAVTTFEGLPSPPVSFTVMATLLFALTEDGRVFSWPDTSASSSAPVELSPSRGIVSELSLRAVRVGGAVHEVTCGLGPRCVVAATPWPSFDDATAVWSGDWAVCARRSSGEVWCSFDYRIGDDLPGVAIGVPTHLPMLDGAVEVAIDDRGLCAIDATGRVLCWGERDRGRLGTNDPHQTITTPVADGATDLGLGPASCAVHDNQIVCWGQHEWSGGLPTCRRPFAGPVTPR